VQNEAAKERIRLNEEIQTRKMLDLRNDHQAAAAKIVQMSTLKNAFGIVKEKEMGAAFDQEL